MAPIIHMETIQTRDMSTQIKLCSLELSDRLLSRKQSIYTLNWEGPSWEEFLLESLLCIQHLQNSLDQIEQLGASLSKEVDEWEEISFKFLTY